MFNALPGRMSFGRASLGRTLASAALALATLAAALAAAPAHATTTLFDIDPFTGSTAPTTPGRQVFAGLERTLPSFAFGADAFAFNSGVFGLGSTLTFANGYANALPAAGANVIVLRDTDNDNDAATPFNAGSAASLIAGQVTADGAGFFVYHNSALNVNRLVYSANLNDATADLSVLARIASPTGVDAINALPQFGANNFAVAVPEPSTYALFGIGLAGLAIVQRRRRAR
jgi:PEP-CTERM motif